MTAQLLGAFATPMQNASKHAMRSLSAYAEWGTGELECSARTLMNVLWVFTTATVKQAALTHWAVIVVPVKVVIQAMVSNAKISTSVKLTMAIAMSLQFALTEKEGGIAVANRVLVEMAFSALTTTNALGQVSATGMPPAPTTLALTCVRATLATKAMEIISA